MSYGVHTTKYCGKTMEWCNATESDGGLFYISGSGGHIWSVTWRKSGWPCGNPGKCILRVKTVSAKARRQEWGGKFRKQQGGFPHHHRDRQIPFDVIEGVSPWKCTYRNILLATQDPWSLYSWTLMNNLCSFSNHWRLLLWTQHGSKSLSRGCHPSCGKRGKDETTSHLQAACRLWISKGMWAPSLSLWVRAR